MRDSTTCSVESGTQNILGLSMGVPEAHKEAVKGTKMTVYFAVTLDPCPTRHPWAACAISLQLRAF